MGAANTEAIDKILRRLAKAENISFAMVQPLLESFELILVEGNRRNVLSGLDGKGQPMAPVTYRNGINGKPTGRRGQNFGQTKFAAKGVGFRGVRSGNPHANGNLTTAEYKQLTGPPLAPRREQSRVITNISTAIGQHGQTFYARKGWIDIVDKKGNPFIEAHFKGAAVGRNHSVKLPIRDLRGIDPRDKSLAAEVSVEWAHDLLAGRIP